LQAVSEIEIRRKLVQWAPSFVAKCARPLDLGLKFVTEDGLHVPLAPYVKRNGLLRRGSHSW
jgi:hypothetical protein